MTIPRRAFLVVLLVAPSAAVAGCILAAPVSPAAFDACGLRATDVAMPPEIPIAPPGPGATVTIRTDADGVSHVYADDAWSLFYGNGYVQARDRLFQMDVLRHAGRADSASVVGPAQLESDFKVARDLYSNEEIRAQFEAAPAWVQEGLRAFAAGVNRRMAEDAARGTLPAEFAALQHAPHPWTPEDTIAVVDFLIGYFGVAGGEEVLNARKVAALSESLGSREAALDAFTDFKGVVVGEATTSIPPADKTVDGCERLLAPRDVPREQLDLAMAARDASPWGYPEGFDSATSLARRGEGLFDGFHWGSNAMLVSGAVTASGLPIMFGGPQMGYYKPPIPYEVGLHGAGFDATGIGVAGAPGIVIGRTPTFAWSVTSGIDDQVDSIALALDPMDPHRFAWDGAWETMTCRTVLHRTVPSAGDREPPRVLEQEVCRARGMPVVAWSPSAHVAWAQRTTTRNLELTGAIQWLMIARQADLAGVMDAVRAFPFTFNFHYAGPEGIAFLHTGAVPVRDPALDPRLPALAGDAHAWRAVAAGLDLGTSVVNPSTGYVVNWNNAPVRGWRTGDVTNGWDGVQRVDVLDRLARELVAEKRGAIAWDDVAGVLEGAALRESYARHAAPALADAIASQPELAPLAEALRAWAATDYLYADADGDGAYDHPGHAVWDAARLALQDLVFRDELGEATPALTFDPKTAGTDPHAADHGNFDNKEGPLVKVLRGTSRHAWCDDVSTPARETCEDALVAAARRARDELETEFGTRDVDAWRLAVHTTRFTPIGAGHADEFPVFNRGSWNQVVAIGAGIDGARGVLPPSNSGAISLADLAASRVPGGGENPRLTNQLAAYLGFEFRPLPVTPEEVDDLTESAETLTVVPVVGIPAGPLEDYHVEAAAPAHDGENGGRVV